MFKFCDVWKIELRYKHVQKLFFDLIERWILWCDEIKNRKNFEIKCIRCDRDYSTFNHFSNNSSIRYKKQKKNEKKFEFKICCHSINCKSNEILKFLCIVKVWIVNLIYVEKCFFNFFFNRFVSLRVSISRQWISKCVNRDMIEKQI